MKNNTLAIALASLLVGGVAVAAFEHARAPATPDNAVAAPIAPAPAASLASGDSLAQDNSIAPGGTRLDYADVVNVQPVSEKQKLYAQVIGTEPVRETSTVSTPREVCNDVVVQEQAPRRDPHNVGGTVAGAVIGGLIGNQVGAGTGKKLATVGGAVGGAFAGRAIEQRHAENQTVSRTEHQCHTESSTSQASRVVAYNVTYRNPDGTTGTMRMGSRPGSRILVGSDRKAIGYDVTYRYEGSEHTVRMAQKPEGDRLPVVDGKVVTQVAAMDAGASRQ
ncbi:MAG TPA: glycine zipper 2TM domain-containing protein [Xanthomonadaceae bacterium]|nr:glycine zipper 2TM domain-containing protein [Xanthomonadaceae bacterium]